MRVFFESSIIFTPEERSEEGLIFFEGHSEIADYKVCVGVNEAYNIFYKLLALSELPVLFKILI
jgi:hypothetical protein